MSSAKWRPFASASMWKFIIRCSCRSYVSSSIFQSVTTRKPLHIYTPDYVWFREYIPYCWFVKMITNWFTRTMVIYLLMKFKVLYRFKSLMNCSNLIEPKRKPCACNRVIIFRVNKLSAESDLEWFQLRYHLVLSMVALILWWFSSRRYLSNTFSVQKNHSSRLSPCIGVIVLQNRKWSDCFVLRKSHPINSMLLFRFALTYSASE